MEKILYAGMSMNIVNGKDFICRQISWWRN